jgi:hypothetical protein
MRRDTVRNGANRFGMPGLGATGHSGRRGKSIELWRIKKLMWHLRCVWGYKNGNNCVARLRQAGFRVRWSDAQVESRQELYERSGEISA